jgi:hypothetical protein
MHDLDVHSSQKIKNENNEPCERELNLDQKSHYPLQQGVCHPVTLPYTLKVS